MAFIVWIMPTFAVRKVLIFSGNKTPDIQINHVTMNLMSVNEFPLIYQWKINWFEIRFIFFTRYCWFIWIRSLCPDHHHKNVPYNIRAIIFETQWKRIKHIIYLNDTSVRSEIDIQNVLFSYSLTSIDVWSLNEFD